jgi:peptidoglycan/LPS O-acetylase OafA/YrhL
LSIRDTKDQPNVVSAVRTGRRRSGNPRLRRRILGTLALVAIAAFAYVALADDQHTRAWAGVVALVSLLAVAITWLAGVSGSLSDSGRDPGDFID